MDIGTFIAASAAGGVGAALRWVIDMSVTRRSRSRFPWGIWLVNVSGSFALGVLTGWLGHVPHAAAWMTIVGAGLLGGYTTFSTVAVASVTFVRDNARRIALVNIAGTFVACVLASLAGVWCGGLVPA